MLPDRLDFGPGVVGRRAGRKKIPRELAETWRRQVRRRMEELEWKDADLTRRLGRDPGDPDQVKRVNAWKSEPPGDIVDLLSLARVLGRPIEWLLTDQSLPHPPSIPDLSWVRDHVGDELRTRRILHPARADEVLPSPDQLWYQIIVPGIIEGYDDWKSKRVRGLVAALRQGIRRDQTGFLDFLEAAKRDEAASESGTEGD